MALYSIIPTLHASQRIEKERILFKAESSVGSEAEIIGYGVKPKIKRNSDTITNQPSSCPFLYVYFLIGSSNQFPNCSVAKGRSGLDHDDCRGDRNCAAAVIADATHGPNDFDKLSK
jgi:hypothetical protein